MDFPLFNFLEKPFGSSSKVGLWHRDRGYGLVMAF
jgi:hypothetical protein